MTRSPPPGTAPLETEWRSTIHLRTNNATCGEVRREDRSTMSDTCNWSSFTRNLKNLKTLWAKINSMKPLAFMMSFLEFSGTSTKRREWYPCSASCKRRCLDTSTKRRTSRTSWTTYSPTWLLSKRSSSPWLTSRIQVKSSSPQSGSQRSARSSERWARFTRSRSIGSSMSGMPNSRSSSISQELDLPRVTEVIHQWNRAISTDEISYYPIQLSLRHKFRKEGRKEIW